MKSNKISVLSLFVFLLALIAISGINTSNSILTKSISVSENQFIGKKEIIVDHNQVLEDLIDFPLLFTTMDIDLLVCQEDGDDIIFYDEINDVQLDHEIEKFNHTIGELVAWVRIPYLSSNEDTAIEILYGNTSAINSESPSAVWEEYDGVYHLSELNDAKGENDLSLFGSVLLDSNGKFASAHEFDGYGLDYLKTDTNFNITNSFSIECWVKISSSDTDQTFITLPQSSTGVAERLMLQWNENIALARNYQTSDKGVNTLGTSQINDGV
ncbi:MAG: DUF2341 domain-containing protein, partial [Candidatus Kariarchaeaceae archaeon]